MTVQAYRLPEHAEARLEALVDSIQADPGEQVTIVDFEEAFEKLRVRATVASLPEGLTEEDLVAILRLALLTECATLSYSQVFAEGATTHRAPWLGRFNERVWTPDELRHHAPFKLLLLGLGYSEEELDRQIRETREKAYTHSTGKTPVHLTTFGMIQEYLTDHWYGLISGLLKPEAPDAAGLVRRVKKRETLHTIWYRDMTAIQISGNSDLLALAGESLAQFTMPGNVLVPELQGRASGWIPRMGGSFDRMSKDMVRLIYETVEDVRKFGSMLVDLAVAKRVQAGPVPLSWLRSALDITGGRGYGLIGEAVLDRVGLRHLYRPEPPRILSWRRTAEFARAPVRRWISRQINVRLDGATAAA